MKYFKRLKGKNIYLSPVNPDDYLIFTEWLNDQTDPESIAANYDLSDFALPYDFLEEFEQMELQERQFILDELADRPELWDEESEVMLL